MIDWVTPPRSHSRASFTLRTGSQWNKCCSTTLQHRWRGGSDGNGSTGVANLAVTGQRRPATTKTLAAADQRRRTVAPGLDVDVAAPRRKYTAHHASQSRSRPLASVRVAEIIRYPSLDNHLFTNNAPMNRFPVLESSLLSASSEEDVVFTQT